jgi:hypothetical protein
LQGDDHLASPVRDMIYHSMRCSSNAFRLLQALPLPFLHRSPVSR